NDQWRGIPVLAGSDGAFPAVTCGNVCIQRSIKLEVLMDRYSPAIPYRLPQPRFHPIFTPVAGPFFPLGIRAHTALFQLLNAIRLRSLPVANPQELAYVDYAPHSRRGGWWSTRSATFTSANWESIRQHQEAFSDVIAWSAYSFNLVAEGKARYAEGLFVSGD